MDDLDTLDRFFAAVGTGRPVDLAAWERDYPHLADEFRLLLRYDALETLREPVAVPGYALLGPIRRGGMGDVLEGYDPVTQRSVAIKYCPAVGSRSRRERFEAEWRTLARLHQSSIVPVFAAGRHGLWLYCVMPLIDGATLADLIRLARAAGPGPYPPLPALVTGPATPADLPAPGRTVRVGPDYLRSAVESLTRAADAVAFAHRHGVWHLDLKPSNLMVEETGHVWVIDFGLARDAAGPATDPGGPVLSAAYAAPEQWDGAGDARSDVWGLGATLYALLALRHPFDGTSRPEHPPAALRAATPDLPPDLEAVCLKALALRPEDRYPSAAALAADLRRWLDGEETTARPWSPLRRVRELARRHRAWAAAVAASLFGMVATLALLWQMEQARGREAAAESNAARNQAEARRHADAVAWGKAWARVEEARVGLSLPTDGRRAAVRRLLLAAARERPPGDDAPGFRLALRSVYAQSLGLLDLRQSADRVTTHSETWLGIGSVDIHPDGRALAIALADRPVVWRRADPPPATGPNVRPADGIRVAYGPVGRVLAEVRPPAHGGQLRLWDETGSRPPRVLVSAANPAEAVLAVGFDSAETRLFAASADGRVRAWALSDLAEVPAPWAGIVPPAGVSAAAFAAGGDWVAFAGPGQVVAAAAGGPVTRIAVFAQQPVQVLAWSPDARRLAVGVRDGGLHVVGRDGVPAFSVSVAPSGVTNARFSPDGRWLFGYNRNFPSQVWDSHTGRLALGGAEPIWAVARDGRSVAIAASRSAAFGELVLPGAVDTYTGHRVSAQRSAWAPDGRRFVTLSTDFEVRVWDTARPGVSTAFDGPPADEPFSAPEAAVALGPEGRMVAYASSGPKRARAVVWDVAARRPVAEWELPGGYEALAPAGPGRFLSVREEIDPRGENVSSVARVLEAGRPLPQGRVMREPEPGDGRRFISSELLPGGRHYLWCGPRRPPTGRRVELYDVDTGTRVWQLIPPTHASDHAPTALLTPDLRTALVDIGDGTAFRYALPPRDPPERVRVETRAFSPDGRLAVTEISRDGTAVGLAVGPAGGEPTVAFPLLTAPIAAWGAARFSPDGRHLIWCSTTGAVTVVDLSALEAELARFEADLARPE